MSFPACRHRRKASAPAALLRWLAAEPYRVFFASGALWSIVGVALWPLYHAQLLGFYPGFAHARIMIEAFGGAFVVGFLGTAGPRMASAPKLTPWELAWLLVLHQACALSHLTLRIVWGDGLFVALLLSLLLCLVVRVLRFRQEPPPAQMLLALAGLLCGMGGALLLLSPSTFTHVPRLRLAQLLLYQGCLLPPVLGVGSFVFPRMLGGGFGEAASRRQQTLRSVRALAAAAGLLGSFFLEAYGHVAVGYGLRAGVAAAYLLLEVRWRTVRRGSLTTGLKWALGLGALGLVLAPMWPAQHVTIEHLLYIGGFGMLMLIVGSRVLFGHSGDLEGFFARGGWPRWLVFLGVLAALTRATPAWRPSTTVSHHIYAAVTWAALTLGWLLWHRRRFSRRDKE